jgi:tetratricopeptide (TPR) repeat protein
MSPRARVLALVALAAAGAAGATVGITVLTTRGEHRSAPTTSSRGRPGPPPLFLDLEQLVRRHPRSGAVQLNEGFALLQNGRVQAARAAWRRARKAQPDSMYAVQADNFLHPNLAPGLPPFVPNFPAPPELGRLSPPRQLAFLAARARHGNARDRILYGVALQGLGRPVSAERQFRAATELAPRDPESRTAAAVGLFDKSDPALAFGRLGPLTRAFPHAATVRFHLGLLLLWIGQAEQGKRELRLARQEAPGSRLAREATRFLTRLGGIGTNRRKR